MRKTKALRWLVGAFVACVLIGIVTFQASASPATPHSRRQVGHGCFDVRELHICLHG